MTSRREVVVTIGLSAVAAPLLVQAQQPGKMYRVGLVFTTAPLSEMAGPNPVHPAVRAFLQRLGTLGYVEGRNLVFERRSAEGKVERFRDILEEFLDLKVDVIVTVGDVMAQRAKEVTTTVPIVMASSENPVEMGLVASLARPGGNITGLTRSSSPEIEGKRVELLKEALPKISRVALLGMKIDWEGPFGKSAQAAARVLGITLLHAEHTFDQHADAFAMISRTRPDALLVVNNVANFARRRLIADFATKSRLPGMGAWQEFAEAGGLMSYGTNVPDQYRRAAEYVDRILKGAKPADLPIEQPTKFELVVNLKTAKALGITIPQSILVRADRVIE